MTAFEPEKISIHEVEVFKELMPPARWDRDLYRGESGEIPTATENWMIKRGSSRILPILKAAISYFIKDPNRPLLYSDIFSKEYNGNLTPYSWMGYDFQTLSMARQRGLLEIRKVPFSQDDANPQQRYMLERQLSALAELRSALETSFSQSQTSRASHEPKEGEGTDASSDKPTARIQLVTYDDYQIFPTKQAISLLSRSPKLLELLDHGTRKNRSSQ